MNTQSNNDVHEEILINLIELDHRLSFLSKVEVSSGEVLKREELNALFGSFSRDMKKIIESFQSVI